MIIYLQITTTAAATTTTQQQQQQQPQQQATMVLKAVKPLHLMRPRGCSGHISSGLCFSASAGKQPQHCVAMAAFFLSPALGISKKKKKDLFHVFNFYFVSGRITELRNTLSLRVTMSRKKTESSNKWVVSLTPLASGSRLEF